MIRIDDFQHIVYKKRTYCAVCEEKLENPIIVLPKLPLTEIYTKTKPTKFTGFADQEFYVCDSCGHGQLGNIISPKILYTSSSYFFMTSKSKTATGANDYFLAYIDEIIKDRRFKNIIELGCSDLYLINALKPKAQKLYGIDPVLAGKEKDLSSEKVEVIGDFFENVNLERELAENTLVISSHTFEHVEDPKKMIASLLKNASEETLFIHQFPSLEPMIKDLRYDQIFHQHLHYFSLSSFFYMIESLGGEIVDYKINYLHWGALMVVFKKKSSTGPAARAMPAGRQVSHGFAPSTARDDSYLDHTSLVTRYSGAQRGNPRSRHPSFALIDSAVIKSGYQNFRKRMEFLNNYLQSLKGEKIYGFGAALMLPILGYHLDNDFSSFSAILDDDKKKEGLYYINLPVPIKTPERVNDIQQANVLITAYNTVRSVLPRVLSFAPKRIIFPTHVI